MIPSIAIPPGNGPLVALCVNSAWNVANFRAGLVRSLADDGYRMVVIAPPDHPLEALRALGCGFMPLAMDRGSMSPLHDAQLFLKLRGILSRLRPAALLGYTIKPNVYGSLAAHSLRIPVINNIAGLGTMFLRGRAEAAFARSLYGFALRRSHVVFFQNPDDSRLFLQERLVRPEQARLLPGSGIDVARFAPAPLPAGDGDAVTFVLIARLLRDKGVAEYAAAARLLREEGVKARFLLVGAHDPDNAASIAGADLQNWVSTGVLDYRGSLPDVRGAIAEADCVVLPSYREGLPRTLLEGAAMARPLVATDVPGCRELVDEGVNGHLCPAMDAAGLAATLRQVAESGYERRAQMGLASRRLVEQRFDERMVVDAYRTALAEVCGLDGSVRPVRDENGASAANVSGARGSGRG